MSLPDLPMPGAGMFRAPADITPVRAYAEPVLATHLDGTAIGCEVVPHTWLPRGLVVLVDADGNIAIDRYHSENAHIEPRSKT